MTKNETRIEALVASMSVSELELVRSLIGAMYVNEPSNAQVVLNCALVTDLVDERFAEITTNRKS